MSKSANKLEFQTYIKDGKWTQNTSLIKAFNEAWNNCFITVTLHKKNNKRSKFQNGYYWAVIIPILQNCMLTEWGEIHSKEDIHEFLLTNFNYEELIVEDTGEVFRKVRRSKNNDTKQQEAYHEKCRQFIKEYFNTEVPLPEHPLKIDFGN